MTCAEDPAAQAAIWAVRRAGLNIVMSMKGDRKPVSIVEDCAVPLSRWPSSAPPSRRSSRGTAPARPGTRTPRWGACTCVRRST